MAEIQQKDSGERKKGKQKKFSIRVDFTPMVDMNMLLITFFMLCTSMSKPQTMEISMPRKDLLNEQEQNKVKASKAMTILLGKEGECTIIWESRTTRIPIWCKKLIFPRTVCVQSC